MRIGLGKIAQKTFCCEINIFTEETQVISAGEEGFEYIFRILLLSNSKECLD